MLLAYTFFILLSAVIEERPPSYSLFSKYNYYVAANFLKSTEEWYGTDANRRSEVEFFTKQI